MEKANCSGIESVQGLLEVVLYGLVPLAVPVEMPQESARICNGTAM